MEPIDNKPAKAEEETKYLLIDGSTVSAEEATRIGVKSRKTLRNLGFFCSFVGLIVLIQCVIDLTTNGSGWLLFLFVEAIILGFAGSLFYFYRRTDDERYGVSILNFQKRMQRNHPQDALVSNGILADILLELNASLGNFVYVNEGNKTWQYRLKNKLSPVFEKGDLASFELVKNGLKFDPSTPDLSVPDAEKDRFGILLRFAAANRPSVELDCRTRQVALECLETLKNLKK